MDARENPAFSALYGTSSSTVVADSDPTFLRMARSSSVGASTESFVPSLPHHHHHHQSKNFLTSSQPPPPVAMSLRARETSAMALKHIFDQQMMNNGGYFKEQEGKSTQGQRMGGLQGTRNQSMPDLRKRVPLELDLSFRKAQKGNWAYTQAGFGSPISTPNDTNQTLLSHGQPVQSNILPQAATLARLNASERQPSAPLTIFYSGSVAVYDDVPADKANAIMLLAGNPLSYTFKCAAMPITPPPASQPELIAVKERTPSPQKAAPSQQQVPASPATKTSYTSGSRILSSSLAPTASTAVAMSVASPPQSPAPALPSDGVMTGQPGVLARRSHAGIELPHARKASLARFLEKRKDRVQGNQDNEEGGVGEEKRGGEEGESSSFSGKPADHHPTESSSSKKKQCIEPRPSSPSRDVASNNHNDNIASTNRLDSKCPSRKGSLNEHCFFP